MRKPSQNQRRSFKDKVFSVVSRISPGSVLMYKEVARRVGSPRAARAVGNILKQNFNPNVPCHRVIKSSGEFGDYNRGGAQGKRNILLAEKALESLLARLKKNGALRDARIESAFRAVHRIFFVPRELRDEAYEDYPLPIGFSATISQPTTVAFMLEKLDVRPGQKVLDIGSGSGWTTALLSYLVGPRGKVIGLEIIPELVAFGSANLKEFYCGALEDTRMEMAPLPEIKLAKKGAIGDFEEAPFDRILVSAAAQKIPQELMGQLKPEGVLLIPIGVEHAVQKIIRIEKMGDDALATESYPGFVFVPLVGD